eukprot:TRINITY_DN1552_c0_g1_i1.p1 TRINITY_DN1552_c0_g1~~TRINITY_DN1552_c0_g1_i1.p1  ORF type:complete len:406 (+),score=96.37 TRINITY_DN1552_c0_g1_i1:25-1242(+)
MSSTVQRCTPYVVVLAFGMLLTGTINTVLSKAIYDKNTTAEGCCGYTNKGIANTMPHPFQHPWFQTWIMFLGELLCIIPFFAKKMCSSGAPQKRMKDPINADTPKKAFSPFSYIFAIPASCDLTASTLGSIALLWIPASVWQMMRGANIIFTGILSMIFLKAKLGPHKWFGMFLVVGGLILVGLSGLLGDSSDSDPAEETSTFLFVLGIFLVLGAQLIAASQFIVEETLLKGSGFEPLNVVFMEGFWGVAILTTFALPLVYLTPEQTPVRPELMANFTPDPAFEVISDNFLDALTQMKNNPLFLIENIGVLLSIAFFNFFGLTITTKLTSVHRMLIDACRTMFVWASLIVLGYLDFSFGEKLSYYSFFQLGGFVLLVCGTLIYNEVIKLPCFVYPIPDEEKPLKE